MIRGADGLEYADLAAILLGEPAQTPRNAAICAARGRGGGKSLIQALCDLPPEASPAECQHTIVAQLAAAAASDVADGADRACLISGPIVFGAP